MLKHIPFYASLLGRTMSNGKKSNNGMVLVYGAIEVHAMGEKGCIASNKRIADETGLSAGTVANYISELNRSGWVEVVTKNINGGIVRLEIKPLLTIEAPSRKNDTPHTSVKPPSPGDDTPLHASVNIGNTIENIENTGLPKGKGDTPKTYGNTDINGLFEYWSDKLGYSIEGNVKRNRIACSNLIRKHGIDAVKRLVDGVELAQMDKYAPRISNYVQLQAKQTDLIVWGKSRVAEQQSNKIVEV